MPTEVAIASSSKISLNYYPKPVVSNFHDEPHYQDLKTLGEQTASFTSTNSTHFQSISGLLPKIQEAPTNNSGKLTNIQRQI